MISWMLEAQTAWFNLFHPSTPLFTFSISCAIEPDNPSPFMILLLPSFPRSPISVLCLAGAFIFFLLNSVTPQIFSHLAALTQCWVSWTHKTSSQEGLDTPCKGRVFPSLSPAFPWNPWFCKTVIHFTFPARTNEGPQKEHLFPWK